MDISGGMSLYAGSWQYANRINPWYEFNIGFSHPIADQYGAFLLLGITSCDLYKLTFSHYHFSDFSRYYGMGLSAKVGFSF